MASSPQAGTSGGLHAREYAQEQRVVALLMSRVGSKGTDVRVATGQFMRPSRLRHQSARADWWRWKKAFGCAGKKPAHINELEIRGAPLDLQRRTRKASEN